MAAAARQLQLSTPEVQSLAADHHIEENGQLYNSTSKEAHTNINDTKSTSSRKLLIWPWLLISLYSLLILVGQSLATLLGRLYFDQGGNSKWLNTLVQSVGFPLLIPLFFLPNYFSRILTPKNKNIDDDHEMGINNIVNGSSTAVRINDHMMISSKIPVYLILGVLLAGDNLMYTYGTAYLPASTFSLITATQLPFNAVFSFFLNSQRFTAAIWNSLVLLILSSVLLAANSSGERPHGVTPSQFYIGFICTVFASALYGFVLSFTQYCMRKFLIIGTMKKGSFMAVLEIQMSTAFVTSVVAVIGLFASGEGRVLGDDEAGYRAGRVSYVLVNVWMAIGWQMSYLGGIGLLITVSSLFANVINVLALPVVPVLAVFIFHDKMDGVKIIALLMSLWGSISYVYHQAVEEKMSDKKDVMINGANI